MKKFLLFSFLALMLIPLTACSSENKNTKNSLLIASAQTEKKEVKIKVTVGKQVMTATLLDNDTAKALIAKFPLTLPMQDLYAREMCYRFPDPLPASGATTSGYEIGDISYWTPRHSLVIFYKQNGEVITNLQKIGNFDSSVRIFEQTGDTNVTFELLNQ